MKLEAKGVKKDFARGGNSGSVLEAVKPLDFSLESGELVEITGRSGSGKSTLLSMMAGMLVPTGGSICIDDTDIYSMKEEERSRLRNDRIGLIPQGHTALRSLTVLENVMLPFVLYHRETPPEDRAKELLQKVGLFDMKDERPNALSGGELRRMAVARALLMKPEVLLADEPTAGLDDENVELVMELLRSAADEGASVLLVTHENEARKYADRVLAMDGGRLCSN
ncbi:ABC transporter ATP-binding protein [Schwartzia succinivorans]|jgi:putative ABC transport system ATP-binding protein|uniref:Putative ABC transport system ATP-binding protein n=1 Tax=Schwartzia succinivorans DSM 10502 TaxID=1123243 RepID=A0A1M4YEA7_9FIRM|nr:ABC transporter ATP-binding protein [Schwartzia succinivorans]MBE6097575.1 ABC transporter ATP-binding protein [Schwartzia succinivorans]SHF04164.1 putative ABC transport system ATP-binding protein [Schwartzia succinivorans DSM 10502]